MGQGLLAFIFTVTVSSVGVAALPQPNGFGPLKNIPDAPAPIQIASKAVVRVRTLDGGAGTGFFLKQGDRLVTNEHVVGHENCSREGCYFEIDFSLEQGSKVETKEVFGVPVMSLQDFDVTVLDLYLPENGNPIAKRFKPPAGLDFSTQSEEKALSEDLYIVGHGFGGLKRWSAAPVYRRTGDWCASTHCVPSGNSGSPVLSADGTIVGLVHRANHHGDELTDLDHVRHSARFSLVAPFKNILDAVETKGPPTLKPFLSIPLSGKKVLDPKNEEDNIDVTSETLQVLASRKLWGVTFELNGESEKLKFMELLEAGCGLEIEATPDTPDHEYSMCTLARELIDCTKKFRGDEAGRCPKGKERKKWVKHFSDIADYLELKNQDHFIDWKIAPAIAFAENKTDGRKKAREILLKILETHPLPRIDTAYHLTEVSSTKEDMEHGGTDYLKVLLDYKKEPFFAQYYDHLSAAVSELARKDSFLTKEELEAYFTALLEDPKVPVILKSDLETRAHEREIGLSTSK